MVPFFHSWVVTLDRSQHDLMNVVTRGSREYLKFKRIETYPRSDHKLRT